MTLERADKNGEEKNRSQANARESERSRLLDGLAMF